MKNAKNLWRILGYVLIPALFFCFGNSLRAQDTYKLVTDASTLATGDEVLIVGVNSGYYAMTATTTSNRRGAVAVTVTDGVISNPDIADDDNKGRACVFTLEKDATGNYAFHDLVNSNYLTSTTNTTTPSATEAHYFSVSIAATGKASVKATIQNGRYIRFLSSDFRSYTTENGTGNDGYDIQLYKKQAEAPTTPYIRTDKSEVNWTIQPTENLNENLFFTAGNLEEDLRISVASDIEGQEAVITVEEAPTISKEDATPNFELTLTTGNLPEGEYSDIITLTSGEVTATVKVNLKVEMNYPYKKITTTNEVTAGLYLFVNEGKSHAAGVLSGTYLAAASVSISGTNEIEDKGDAVEFELEKSGDGWTIKSSEGYLKTKQDKSNNLAYTNNVDEATSWPITVSDDATIGIKSTYGTLQYNYNNGTNPRFTNYTGDQTAIQLYKKQVPEKPTCDTVTASDDGWVSPTATGADIMWNAPEKGTIQGYDVTLFGPDDYEKLETVTTGTHIDWPDELIPETEYTCTIVTLCGENFNSDPVEFKFTTLAASAPALDISSPAANHVSSTGSVVVEFTTTNFDLDDSHLVKAELKEQSTNQAAAPVLKTLYTKTTSLTISGLANGKYHVDLYMVEVKDKTEGSGKDTVVVGFNPANPNYVHRNFEVKHPAVYFTPNTLKIKTFRGFGATDTVKVTGWALPENSTVNFTSDNTNVTVTPATLTQEQVMATGGAKIAVAYNGAEAAATATITATWGTDISSAFIVNAIARDTLANLKGIYSRVANDTVLVRGKMVVMHKDSAKNCRVWVQDIEKENGASMLLYGVPAAEYKELKVGDVLENVAGTVAMYNQIYELVPLGRLEATEQGHAVYVDTLSIDEVKANSTKAEAQSALVCIKDVQFKNATGNFASGQNYTLQQGEKELTFRTDFAKADYIGKPVPTSRLYVTVIVSDFKGTAQVASRNLADMVKAPCPLPTEISVDATSNKAELDWEGWPANYSVRYGTAEDLSGATPVSVATSHLKIESLVAETKYYYQIKSVCGADGYESDWTAVDEFTTLSAHAPAISMISPVDRPMFTDSVLVHFHLENVTLKAGDTTARIVFSDGKTVENYTDTVYKYAMPSGDHSVQVILTKNDQKLNPSVETRVRYFSVDLPDVAKPEFAPKAGRYKDSVEVTLNCDTEGASIFYAQGEGEWVAYTAGSKIVLKENATLKAFACKERMDTSAVATAAYTIYSMLTPEGDVILAENFDACNTTWTNNTDISTKLDEYTTVPGWTGAKVYTGPGNVKLGTGSAKGSLTTPSMNLSYNNGKYYVAFTIATWAANSEKDSIYLKAGDATVVVKNIAKQPEMTEYVYMFENGTADTKITFEAAEASSNRFYIDSVRVYQVLPDVPRLSATPAMFEMKTVQGTPATQTVTVKGNRLASDVTVSCLQANNTFSVSAESLTKEAVMGEAGAELTVTFNASVAEDSAKIELVSGDLHQTVMVRAFATQIVEVENIAALRAGEQNTLYKVKGEVVVTAIDGISTWVQDASAAIQIYGSTGTTYAVGDGITGILGSLSDYHGLIELVPNGAQPAATTHDNKVEPQVMTVEELNEKGADYSSRLIRINGLALNGAEGNWSGGKSYNAADEAGNEILIYTTLSHGDYIGEALPKGKFDLIAIAGYRDGTVQISPRVKEDIIAAGGGDEDDCEAPTNLMYSGSTKITVKWNGSANEYKLALLSKDGKDTVMTKMLTVTEYTFGDEVKPNVEYGWAVASVCENGKLVWAKGQNFQIETANEEAELQADVYPNPTDGVVYIKLAESVRMEIFTLGGTVLRSEELAAGRNEIRLDRSGIYFIRLTNGTATTVRRVVVR